MAMKFYSKLLPPVLGPYRVTLTIFHKVIMQQDTVLSTISAYRSSLPRTHMQLKKHIVGDKHNQSWAYTSGRDPGQSNNQPE